MTPRIYFGGSFDPVHIGHLRVAIEVRQRLRLVVRMLPVADPLHRDGLLASAEQRLHMLKIATDAIDGVVVDAAEIALGAPTFTSKTLSALAKDHPSVPIGFVVGADAFAGISRWRNYPEVLEQCHFVVINRPGNHDLREILKPYTARLVDHWSQWENTGGTILPLSIPPLDISATEVRDCLTGGGNARYLVPDAVLEFIENNGIYRR